MDILFGIVNALLELISPPQMALRNPLKAPDSGGLGLVLGVVQGSAARSFSSRDPVEGHLQAGQPVQQRVGRKLRLGGARRQAEVLQALENDLEAAVHLPAR